MKNNIFICGGGTGGHITPALSIFEVLKDNYKVYFLGNKNSLEEKIYTKYTKNFLTIKVTYFKRKKFFSNFLTLFFLFISIIKSIYLILKYNPKFIIGTGGYVSGPILFSAFLLRKDIFIHEQNVFPGITNKILSKFAKTVFISFEESAKYFKIDKSKLLLTGNPVRDNFKNLSSEKAKEKLNIKKDKTTILIFCGSNGSKAVNDHIIKNYNEKYEELYIIFITGKNYYQYVTDNLKENSNLKIYDFMHNINEAIMASDLVIARSGALSLAELSYCKKPSILIPFPFASENHQEYNARIYEKNGASKLFTVNELNSINLFEECLKITKDKKKLEEMSNNAYKLALFDSKEKIKEKINSFYI